MARPQKKRKAWDEDGTADVDNFANKFTANYLFVLGMNWRAISRRVNKPVDDRANQLNGEWAVLKARATRIIEQEPARNKAL